MAISQELLDILVCPEDKGPLKIKSDQSGLKMPDVPQGLSHKG